MLSVLMVDADAPTGGDGLTWTTAYNDLQPALEQASTLNADADPANNIDSIWIAEGTYKHSALLEPSLPRSASFSFVDGVTLYGGFAGTETALEQRDWTAHPVTLSGDIGTLDDNSDNAYTVVNCGATIEAAVDGLSIIGGNADGEYTSDHKERKVGGGVYSEGMLAVTNCTFSDNSASEGSGIQNYTGSLTVTDSVFSGNAFSGPGVISSRDGTLTVADCLLSNNDGGGIYVYTGTSTVTDCMLTSNSGGGVYSYYGTLTVTNCMISDNRRGGTGTYDGELTVTNCIISGNHSDNGIGGIFNNSGTVSVTNSTICGNRAFLGGGGIYNGIGSLTVTNCTITGNWARSGGGIICTNTSGSVRLYNTIVANNWAAEGNDIKYLGVSLSGTCNIIGDGSGQSALVDGVNGNQVGTSSAPIDPLLSDWTQSDNGQWGCRLLPGSPALDAGDNSLAVDASGIALTEDVWGNTRIQNGTVDIGALEGATAGGPAQSYLVTSLERTIANDGVVTFVEAFEAANRNQPVGDAPAGSFAEQDVIEFAEGLTGTVLVDDGELAIMGNLIIEAPGAELVTFDANGQNRVFSVWPSVSAVLQGMTITGGLDDSGGGILNAGALTVNDCTISSNSAGDGYGGGIYNLDSSALTVTNSIVLGNLASNGGGILSYGALTITDSTISNNIANTGNGNGGGIWIYSTTLNVVNSTISDNSSSGGGGGIYNGSGTLILTDSTIMGNSSVGAGGGICSMVSATVVATNSTISNNSTDYNGGGIWNFSSTLTVTNCTMLNNSTIGIYIDSSGVATLNNTIVAANGGSTSPDVYRKSGTLSGSHNLIGNGSGQSSLVNGVNGNQVGTTSSPIDPMLAAWGEPLSGSPAINAGSNALAVDGQGNPLLVDASGRQRVIYGTVDIGAYEYGLPGDASEDYQVGPADAAVLASHWLSDEDVSWDDGDFNGDGRVDDLDASIMAANWGSSVTEGSGTEQAQTPVIIERTKMVGPRRLETTGLLAPARTPLALSARAQSPVEGAGVVQASRSTTVR
ncbi:MAG: right-handed parallel beta-helix repeat-containing protein, partial [Pirellulales bacterium]|nr:right-handed parallel beta-helix repeat-containing protein [Pirellulales bacterium]